MSDHTSIILVGPAHPYSGGIAQHTTRLALELEEAGVPVVVESWRDQYPSALYPGLGKVSGTPEIGAPKAVNESLSWRNPFSWWQVGRRHRGSKIVVNIPTAFHVFPYSVLRWSAGRDSRIVGIVHNVIPHDSGKLSEALMGFLVRSLHHLIVHGNDARKDAEKMGVSREAISVATLPSPWPESERPVKSKYLGPLRLLFFGTVRPYKGLDILLEAVARVPGVTLTVAGEFWEPLKSYNTLITRLGIGDRVTILSGYVPADDFGKVFSEADVLVLPYRRGTGSIVKEVGFRFGLPAIVTQVGSISEGVEHNVNGLVVAPGSVGELADALRIATNLKTRENWQKAIPKQSDVNKTRWADYVNAVRSA